MKQVEEEEEASGGKEAAKSSSSQTAVHRDRFRLLVEACKRKELSKIKRLLGEHPDLLNNHDKFHRNLLHYAAILVLEEQRSLDSDSGKRRVQLLTECLDCFRYLSGKCEPKLWFEVDRDGLTILHLAVISCNTPLVREILFNKAQVYVLQRDQQRLELSTLITALDKEHHSPLHWAVITNNLECVRLLVEHSGVRLAHQADLNGATPLHYATQTSDYPKYRQQLRQMLKNATTSTLRLGSSRNSVASTACSESCCESEPEARKPARAESGEPKRRPELRRRQSTTDSAKLEQAGASYSNLDILDFLAHLPGVNLECRDRDLRTPLLWAASSGNRQAILLLLQCGANYLCQDANNLGPLHCAASHGFTDCLECLLVLAAPSTATSGQVNQADNLNCTPLFYAVLSGNIDCVELLLERGADKDWQDVKGRTAAHFGALRGQLNTLKLLEARGANLWLANKQGDLPLHYAIKSGRQQVVAWLLERSPYERPVNAINNVGRAPIHLAILKGNATMTDFLIRRGANLNQLVKVRDKQTAGARTEEAQLADGPHPARSGSAYRYETALDMARRLNQRECLELLERNSAQSATSVLANRQTQTQSADSADGPSGPNNARSLFDMQAADVASPIGFETSVSSAEPPVEPTATPVGDRLPKVPARPEPTAEPLPQSSDSAASSRLSNSSLTSLRGQKSTAERRAQRQVSQPDPDEPQSKEQDAAAAAAARQRPYRGGINYHNDRINASIKCKLYENQIPLAHHSFPPLSEQCSQSASNQRRANAQAKHQSAGSLPERAGALIGRGCSGAQQEIITNVNVYTSSPCAHCFRGAAADAERQKCQKCSGLVGRQSSVRGASTKTRAGQGGRLEDGEISETSDSTDATSETNYEDSERDEPNERARGGVYVPPSSSLIDPKQSRYAPPSRSLAQQLPVILSAEEERSTSGETTSNLIDEQSGPALVASDANEPSSPRSRAEEEPRFDRSQRGRAVSKRQPTDRHREQARSPVAEYIQGRGPLPDRAASEVRPQPTNARTNYGAARAKVDSRRDDSGLSSHFGDELDGTSAAGRRSKSWSSSLSTPGNRQADKEQFGSEQLHIARSPDDERPESRSCSRQTIIKTRRLSVDSDELASTVEKSIRRYKQESKLFEELQNLKRSQIRSGRANEALLVKRLVEHFRQEALQDSLISIELYRGPYTYQAYELYLYDQLTKLSQTNYARLVGGRVPHKFTYEPAQGRPDEKVESGERAGAFGGQDERDFLDEDLRAEQELQQVLNRGLSQDDKPTVALDETIAIEPTGALDEIRARRQPNDAKKEVEAKGDEGGLAETEPKSVDDAHGTAASTERQARAPSASSSRRSSVAVERDKLDNLPLRVAKLEEGRASDDERSDSSASSLPDEKERARIEREAVDLTSAIITDALGNVSRAGSPKPTRRESQDGQPLREAGESGGEADEADKEQTETVGEGRDRRRSVVNIGDKIEVVYHKVGIEIEPVAEDDHSEEETNDAAVKEEPAEDGAGRAGAESAATEDEAADASHSEDEAGAAPEVTRSESIASQSEEGSAKAAPSRRRSSTQASETSLSRHSGRATLRRASSPPVPIIEQREPSAGAASRRSSSPQCETADAAPMRKVFNGFDLDSLREHRRRHFKQEQDDEKDERQRAAAERVKKIRQARRTTRPRKPRSRLPEGPYRVFVPRDLIRKRWNEVKRYERERRKALLLTDRRSSVKKQIESSGSLAVAADGIPHAISQPNLRTSQAKSKPEAELAPDDFPDMTLIYELNKPTAGKFAQQSGRRLSRRQMVAKQVVWCQKRMTRIVDVRTLKRTLSLPESLIYSNELLKRFNLLKL